MEKVMIVNSPDDFIDILDEYISNSSEMAIKERGEFRLGLSGGSLVDILSKSKLNEPKRDGSMFEKWKVYLADERWCPIDSIDSTFGEYTRKVSNFMEKVNFPCPFKENLSLEEGAKQYEQIFDQKELDLVILGLGPDGHTASLFPPFTDSAMKEKGLIKAVFDAPKPPAERITMTATYLIRAKQIVMVASGKGKAEAIKRILIDKDPSLPPSHLLKNGNIHWLLDHQAAEKIDEKV